MPKKSNKIQEIAEKIHIDLMAVLFHGKNTKPYCGGSSLDEHIKQTQYKS